MKKNYYFGIVTEYKNYTIEKFMHGFIVFFCGDEVFFETIDQAQRFIDEMTESEVL